MIENPQWWLWLVAGLGLMLAELALPFFVLIWFGLGAVLNALVVFLFQPGLTAQLFVWLIFSVMLTVLWFRWLRPERHKTRVGLSEAGVVGEIGLLSRPVEPFRRGEVRFQKPLLGSDVWPCIADSKIANGERVRVLAVEGSLLKVGRLE